MPCDSIILNTVDMPKMNKALRRAALKAAGATDIIEQGDSVYFTLDGGRYELRRGTLYGSSGQSQEQVGRAADLLKRKYSHQVVRLTAQRNGWQLKKTGADSYVAVKR